MQARILIIRIFKSLFRRIRHLNLVLNAKNLSRRNFASASRINKILVLCYGNIYRSPFVERTLCSMLSEFEHVKVKSAGFHDRIGRMSPEDFADKAKERFGIDLTMHRSTVVTRDLISWADIILIMDRFNWDRLEALHCDVQDRTVWLGAFLENLNPEIQDPYGRNNQKVNQIMTRMYQAASSLSDEIIARQKIH